MDRKWTVLMAEIINDIINKVGGNAAITDYNNYWQKGEHKIIFVEQMMTATEANQLSAWWMDRYGVSTNRWNPRKSQKKLQKAWNEDFGSLERLQLEVWSHVDAIHQVALHLAREELPGLRTDCCCLLSHLKPGCTFCSGHSACWTLCVCWFWI